MILALLAACTGAPDSSSDSTSDSLAGTGYAVGWTTDPDPLMAGETGTFTETVTLDGEAIPDLQANHERYVHTIFVSKDLASFTHTHMEDYTEVTADDIRASTFAFPLNLPYSGEYLAVFDYAHHDQWLQSMGELAVGGDVPQLDAPVEDFSTTVTSGDLVVTVTWDTPPLAGFDAAWTAHITTSDGQDVTDLTQWLGADGHAVMVDEGLGWASHTHAWFPDMDAMTPTMTMPHLYPGPDLPFQYAFPVGGTYKMWIQFLRESEPDTVYAVPFMFSVGG